MHLLFAVISILLWGQLAFAQIALHKFVSPTNDFAISVPVDLQKDADSNHKFEATFKGHRYAVASCKIFPGNGFDKSFQVFKKGVEEEGMTLKTCSEKSGAGWNGKLCSFANAE